MGITRPSPGTGEVERKAGHDASRKGSIILTCREESAAKSIAIAVSFAFHGVLREMGYPVGF